MAFDKAVTDYIAQAQPAQIEMLETLRQLMHDAVPGTTEAIKWGFPVFSKTKNYAYFKPSKQYIRLGFYNTDKIEDRDNVLEGTGKDLRHIKIRKPEDINVPLLKKWLKAVAE